MSRRCSLRTHRSAPSSTSAHSAWSHNNRLRCWSIRSCSVFELTLDSWCRDRCGDFIVTTTTTQVDNICIMRVVKNSQEVSLAETLAVTTEKIAGSAANLRSSDRTVSARNRTDSAANEIECLIAREPNTGRTNFFLRCSRLRALARSRYRSFDFRSA